MQRFYTLPVLGRLKTPGCAAKQPIRGIPQLTTLLFGALVCFLHFPAALLEPKGLRHSI
jgi:hypothetical protein